MKNITTAGLLALLIAITVLAGPVSAATLDVNTSSDIQATIDGASPGDTINFANDTYNNFAVTVTKDNLTFLGNGATLIGNSSSNTMRFTITNRYGLTIRDFILNINNAAANGIGGPGVYNTTIKNNTITNGDDAINIYQHYGGLKIIGNTINMNGGRDGISLVNRNVLDETAFAALDSTIIKNNVVSGVQYGIFLGGNFKGKVIGNDVTGTVAGMNITYKPDNNPNNGKLDAIICNNNITGGISLESPEVLFLKLCYNTIIGQVAGTEYSIAKGLTYAKAGLIYVENNDFIDSPVFDDFLLYADSWINNTLEGLPYP